MTMNSAIVTLAQQFVLQKHVKTPFLQLQGYYSHPEVNKTFALTISHHVSQQ